MFVLHIFWGLLFTAPNNTLVNTEIDPLKEMLL